MDQDNEIYFKVITDLSDLKPQFQDLSKFWDKHNDDVSKGEKAYQDYARTTTKAYQDVNKKVKENIGQISQEGKALEQLEKKLSSLSKKNKDAFDSKEVKEFQQVVKNLDKDMGSLEDLNLSVDDIDDLSKKLAGTKDDFEALNVVVDFFEKKMEGAADGSGQAIDSLKDKIERVKGSISSLENLIKDYDNQIDAIAPGRVQSDLIGERNEASRSLSIQKGILENYQQEAKKAREETQNLSTQLRHVKDEMVKLELEGKRNSDQYEILRDKAVEYNEVLKQTNAELNRSASSTAQLDNVIGAVTGLVGVFTVAEGVTALLGEENENFEQALIRVNGAVALLNGLQAIQVELAKKEAISTRALAFVKGQYAIATNSAATATARFNAVLKLSGIGLLISVIAGAVVYWKDIAKFIGLTSDELERSNALNKAATDLYSEQVAQLGLLIKSIKDESLSLEQQKDAVKDYNETFGDTLGTVKDFKELQDKLISSGPEYIEYLKTKAKAEAAYQLAVEKSKEALETRNNVETNVGDYLKAYNPFNLASTNNPELEALGRAGRDAVQDDEASAEYFNIFTELSKEAEAQAKALGIEITESNKDAEKSYLKLSDTLQDLIRKQRDLQTELISNDREREKQVLQDQLDDEKKAYAERIANIKASEEKKAQLIKEFNKIYNEESGLAYEKLRKNIKAIDDKYNEELAKVKLNALSAIDTIILSDEEAQRKAIQQKWDNIREEIFDQIDKTNDELKKEELTSILFSVGDAEQQETKDFDKEINEKKLERQRDLAKSTLEILKTNNKDILNLEQLHAIELLAVDRQFYNSKIDLIKDSFDDLADQNLFTSLVDQLQNSQFIEEIEVVKAKLIEAFGEETASEIIKTVEALNKVQDEIEATKDAIEVDGIGEKISKAFSSFEGFFEGLGSTLGLTGEKLESFVTLFGTLSESLYNSLKEYTELEVQERRRKIDALDESIDGIEEEVERERQLYEDGYANNYETRQQELQALKEQKKQEEEELERALKKKAKLQKAEFLIQTAQQFGDLITSATNIFEASTSLFGPFGVPVAIAAIATMFAGFTAAKVKAFEAIGQSEAPSFRRGLQKGRVSLSGPSHEEGGFGVINSKTGKKVAEVENNEDLIVLNPSQKRAYNHLLDMMISDSRGENDLETSLRNHYEFPKVGQRTMKIVERVNTVTLKSTEAKGEASKEKQNVFKELKDFKESFKKEFEGYKKERDEEVKTWETTEYFFVKTGNTTKKYKKK